MKHKIILSLSLLYFLFRIINLTLLPIFNDESIYLEWGWRMTHQAGLLFYSLYDAKPPLLMWLFGFSESIFADPLFAGRLVSVVLGFLTFIGIYRIGQKFFNSKVAILASLLYIAIPIFSFYDRQALMESAIATVGIWSAYYALLLLIQPRVRYAVMLGVIYGIGFFIKSNAILFLVAYLPVAFVFFLKLKKRMGIFRNTLLMLAVSFLTDIALFMDSAYWRNLSSNSRYTLTPGELIALPFNQWLHNILSNLEISFFFLTPVVLISGILGGVLLFRRNSDIKPKLLLALFLIPVILETVATRFPQQRYLVSYLPLFCVFSAVGAAYLFKIGKRWGVMGSVSMLILPFLITAVQITSPVAYFSLMDKITPLSDKDGYITGQTAGYGIPQAFSLLTSNATRNIFVAIADNSGNPESAIKAMAVKNPAMQVVYLDDKTLSGRLQGVDCLSADNPVYFVSRDDQQVGLDKYLQKVTDFKNPYGSHYIGIYTLKEHCAGNTLHLTFNKDKSTQAEEQKKPLQVPEGWKPFEDSAMNLQFAYPPSLQAIQVTPKLVSLADPSHPAMDDELLIFSTELSTDFFQKTALALHISGQLQHSEQLQFTGFSAVLNVYTNTTGQTQLLLLKQGQQIFAIRYPRRAAVDPQVLNQIVQSITTLHKVSLY